MSKKNSTTSQACAACKHQRRKCGPNCILAPYFPHDRQKQFLNAHKLFGVGRMTDLIKPLGPNERNIAMETIIYQSEMRAYDPVGGCYTLIQQLQSEIEYYQAELQLVLHRLAIFKAQAQQQSSISSCNQVNNVEGIQFQQDQCYETTNIDSNSSITHEVDLNAWMMQNLQSPGLLSPLSLINENENDSVRVDDNNGYIYDQKRTLDLGFKETKSNHQTPVEGMNYSGMKQILNFQDQEQND